MEKLTKPQTNDGRICFRLLAMAQFITQNGEWGFSECKYRLLPGAYKYAINAGTNLRRQIMSAYTPDGRTSLSVQMDTERIRDISLVFDELIDANNIEELLELIKSHKK